MKIALAHDWLNTRLGGAEQVLRVIADLYPDAPIYTLIYNEQIAGETFPRERIRTSTLQRKPGWLKSRPRYLLPLIPAAVEGLDFSGFDLVISSSGAWMKNVLTKPGTRHLCYCHSPMRFVWDYWPQYLEEQRVGPVRRTAIRGITSYLRLWDFEGAARVDRFLANSKTTQSRIQKYYRRDSDLLYPPVELSDLRPSRKRGEYYLCVGALTPYKRFDLAIAACNQLGVRLIISGEGPDLARLKSLAGPKIEFAGFTTRTELAGLYRGAQALLHPQVEDFGITVVESLASGTPVIAYRDGGATETLAPEGVGIFFTDQTAASLEQAIQKLAKLALSQTKMTKRAQEFGTEAFEKAIKQQIRQLS